MTTIVPKIKIKNKNHLSNVFFLYQQNIINC